MQNDHKEIVSIDDLSREILSEHLNKKIDEMSVSSQPSPKVYIIYADGKFYYNFGGAMTPAKMVMLLVALAGTAGFPQIAEFIQRVTTS